MLKNHCTKVATLAYIKKFEYHWSWNLYHDLHSFLLCTWRACLQIKFGLTLQNSSWSSSSYSNKSLAMNMCYIMGMHVHHHHHHHHHLIILTTIHFFNTKLFYSFCHTKWKRGAFFPTPTLFAPSFLGLTSRTILW